jgi:hypothetical protein
MQGLDRLTSLLQEQRGMAKRGGQTDYTKCIHRSEWDPKWNDEGDWCDACKHQSKKACTNAKKLKQDLGKAPENTPFDNTSSRASRSRRASASRAGSVEATEQVAVEEHVEEQVEERVEEQVVEHIQEPSSAAEEGSGSPMEVILSAEAEAIEHVSQEEPAEDQVEERGEEPVVEHIQEPSASAEKALEPNPGLVAPWKPQQGQLDLEIVRQTLQNSTNQTYYIGKGRSNLIVKLFNISMGVKREDLKQSSAVMTDTLRSMEGKQELDLTNVCAITAYPKIVVVLVMQEALVPTADPARCVGSPALYAAALMLADLLQMNTAFSRFVDIFLEFSLDQIRDLSGGVKVRLLEVLEKSLHITEAGSEATPPVAVMMCIAAVAAVC